MHNVATQTDVQMTAVNGCFFVMATQPIETPRRTIQAGTHILIDTSIEPSEGRMVMVDTSLVPWHGQTSIVGVATMTYEEMPEYQRGLRIS